MWRLEQKRVESWKYGDKVLGLQNIAVDKEAGGDPKQGTLKGA
jgi:hypothetical protein